MIRYFGIVIGLLFLSQTMLADLPPNNLRRPVNPGRSTEDEKKFNAILDQIEEMYAPIVSSHGGKLVVERYWADDTVNAYASKQDDKWIVSFFGGFYRHEKVTPDGFAHIACHEMGHHLAGYYFYGYYHDLAAEGSSDYFATHSCLRELWKNEHVDNAKNSLNAPTTVKKLCEQQWSTINEQNLCARLAMAGLPMAQVTADIYGDPVVDFSTPDTSAVSSTDVSHPHGQCRLDTGLAGALCKQTFDINIIPGRNMTDDGSQNSVEAESIAFRYSCSKWNRDPYGYRPACWFKEQH